MKIRARGNRRQLGAQGMAASAHIDMAVAFTTNRICYGFSFSELPLNRAGMTENQAGVLITVVARLDQFHVLRSRPMTGFTGNIYLGPGRIISERFGIIVAGEVG